MSRPISFPVSSGGPVLEVTLLSPTNPHESATRILAELQNVRNLLAEKVTPTYSRFYRSSTGKDEEGSICILGFWPSLKDHLDFLGDRRLSDEVLGPQKDVLRWLWTGHLELSEAVAQVRGKMAAVKVVEICRWTVDVSKKAEFSEMLQRQEEQEGSEEHQGLVFAEGWGVDGEGKDGKGLTEYLRLKAWEKMEYAEKASGGQGRWSQEICPQVEVHPYVYMEDR